METIQSDQLGEVGVERGSVIHFADGIPGFEALHDYLLVEVAEVAPFEWLQSMDDPALAFAVVDPKVIYEGYASNLGRGDLAAVGLVEEADAVVRVILTLSDNPAEITANLQAPLVLNRRDGRGCQLLLTRAPYDIRYPVMQRLSA